MGEGFQFIDIILFAMIAAFLVLRLRSVLGRRDGQQGGNRNPFAPQQPVEKPDNNVVHLPDNCDDLQVDDDSTAAETPETMLDAGIAEIGQADPTFDPEELLVGGRVAFEMILGAFASGDRKALKPLLSSEVYGNFTRAMDEREESGEQLEETLVGIKASEIVEAYMAGSVANVTVKFVSDQVHAVRDGEGETIGGDPNTIIEVTDFWTFAREPRSRDPNWILIATRSLD
jgi:predicted lipid-binding transport protein (Tim44 family)